MRRSFYKYLSFRFAAAALIIVCVIMSGAVGFASEEAIDYSQVAGSGDMASVEEVELEGMKPVYADDIKDGVYDITVKSSSSMFNIEKAVLTVKDGKMEAVMTMGGKGYLNVFMGTGNEAAKADPSQYIDFKEDENGKHTFTVPVEALDKAVPCAAFSKNKHKWYERSLLFEARSMPKEAVNTELPDYEKLEQEAMDKRIEKMKEESDAEKSEAEAETGGATYIYIAVGAVIVIAALAAAGAARKKRRSGK